MNNLLSESKYMAVIPDDWVFHLTVQHTNSSGLHFHISVYRVDDGFGGYLPINGYMVTGNSRTEVVNACQYQCEKFHEDQLCR